MAQGHPGLTDSLCYALFNRDLWLRFVACEEESARIGVLGNTFYVFQSIERHQSCWPWLVVGGIYTQGVSLTCEFRWHVWEDIVQAHRHHRQKRKRRRKGDPTAQSLSNFYNGTDLGRLISIVQDWGKWRVSIPKEYASTITVYPD